MLRNTLLCYALPCLCYELLGSALLLHAMLGYALLPSACYASAMSLLRYAWLCFAM